MPRALWGEVLRHSTWLKNRTATLALEGKTPFEALYGQPPDLSTFRVRGCPVWVHSVDRSKLDPRAREAHWLGPDIDARAHRIFWPVSGTVSVERNVHFGTSAQLEKEEEDNVPGSEQNAAPPSPSACMLNHLPRCAVPPHVRKPSRTASDIQSGMGISSMHTSSTQSTTGTEMPGTLEETVKEAGGAWAVVNSMPELLEDFEGLEYVFAAETTDSEALEPRTLAEARCRPDWLLCEKTIQQELATLKAAGTWRLEDAPPGANIIGRKWVFKLQGQKGRHGERRAIQSATGCTRVQPDWGRRFDDTYAPVARLASSRAIIAMVNHLGLEPI